MSDKRTRSRTTRSESCRAPSAFPNFWNRNELQGNPGNISNGIPPTSCKHVEWPLSPPPERSRLGTPCMRLARNARHIMPWSPPRRRPASKCCPQVIHRDSPKHARNARKLSPISSMIRPMSVLCRGSATVPETPEPLVSMKRGKRRSDDAGNAGFRMASVRSFRR